ncbi:hypothetical protein U8527_07000 [Kordia algicida OT-1]|uniref:Uncharacterized protein n=1 Tax=Kordia algicida OT-1 TaxID=391587 RepID=A9E9N1_9FLAO|nr:hypothetical protein [Kordia algicida]EDP94688.1 hypothetical protein KAOT1_00390 [Kordia algicida OT-1]
MKRKKLPSKRHKGLFLYCNECKKYFSYTKTTVKQGNGTVIRKEPECGKSKSKLSRCKSPEKHRYKSRLHYPGQNQRIISNTLNAETYNEAVTQAIAFEEEFKAKLSFTELPYDTNKRVYLFDAQIRYLDFLNDIGVPDHKKVNRSDHYKNEVKRSLLLFNEALTKNKINKKLMLVDMINDTHVGYFHSHLLVDKQYSNKTYNNKMTSVKGFFKWAIKKFKLNIYNPFEDVRKRTVAVKKETISGKEFKDLLAILSPENGIVYEGQTKRNRYKSYLKDGFELALHTGGRREEIVELKWNMIKEIENEPTYIVVPNLKVQRQKGEGFNDNVAPKIIPVTKSLLKLLLRLGYNENKGSHNYILVPDRSKTSTIAIMNNLSKGFSHYYKKLNTDRDLQLKCLRKTYLSYLNSTLSGDTKSLSSHTSDEILQRHYIDERIINRAVKELQIFDS